MTELDKLNRLLPKPFNGFQWFRLPEYLSQANQEIERLKIVNNLVGRIIQYDGEQITSGTLEVGEQYTITELLAGDDFSNVGYVSDGVSFTATGTTPNTWTNNTTVTADNCIFKIIYNDIDENVTITNSTSEQDTYITITNGAFNIDKTFPNIPAGSNVRVEDSNTVYFNKQNTPRYFKIEIYR